MSDVRIKPDVVIRCTDRILEVLQNMDDHTKDLLKRSKDLDNNLHDQTSHQAIEVSSQIIDMIAKTRQFVIERTETVREAANTLLKIERKAADNRRNF